MVMDAHSELERLRKELTRLAEREAFFRELVDRQPELVCRFTPEGRLTFVNTAYATWFRSTPETLLGGNVLEHLDPEEQTRVRRHLAGFTREHPARTREHKVVQTPGEIRWLQWTDKALYDPEGRLQGFLSVGRDITTRKVVEEALIRVTSEKEIFRLNLEAIFQSIPDAILTVDKEMRLIEANKATRQVCDLLAELEPGIPVDELLCSQESDCCRVLRQTLETRRPVKDYRVECRYARPGQVVVLNTTPLMDARNAFSGAVLTIRDISRLADLEKQLSERHSFQNILGKSEAMQQVYALIEQLADLETTVLVLGESGTGKELVVDALHYGGVRARGPLVKVNCSALSENLLESELFGHVRGSFTGALKDKIGRFQAAEGGTIFLDEIGDISPRIQLKLLRVLEGKEYERVGETRTHRADVRVVAATNVDLLEKVRQGTFREDLYYRLKVVVVDLPPLRRRREDIPLLAEHFTAHFSKSFNKHIPGISDEVTDLFMRYAWPGNVRELKHTIEHACIVCPEGSLTLKDLPAELVNNQPQMLAPGESDAVGVMASGRAPREVRVEEIQAALERTGGNKAKAARVLGMSRRTLYRKLDEYGLS